MSYQTIYDRLRNAGLSEAGALGLLGNWECESNCEPCRVQGDFSPSRLVSREYASKVDNALMSDEAFARDAKGWGLAQWTYWTRKEGLLRFCREHSISVANAEAQVDFCLQELRTEYSSLMALLKNSNDLYQCVSAVCTQYERPAVNNIQQRYEAALRVKGQINTAFCLGPDGTAITPGEDDTSSAADAAPSPQGEGSEESFWPPRMICVGMDGPDVMALQGLLYAHGYNPGTCSGVFDNRTRNMVLAFQAENGLASDGVAGPKTWKKLLEV